MDKITIFSSSGQASPFLTTQAIYNSLICKCITSYSIFHATAPPPPPQQLSLEPPTRPPPKRALKAVPVGLVDTEYTVKKDSPLQSTCLLG